MKQMRSNVSVEFNRGDLKSSISSKEIASKKSLNIPPLDPRIFRLAGSNKKVQRKKTSASFPGVLNDFEGDVICLACHENSRSVPSLLPSLG